MKWTDDPFPTLKFPKYYVNLPQYPCTQFPPNCCTNHITQCHIPPIQPLLSNTLTLSHMKHKTPKSSQISRHRAIKYAYKKDYEPLKRIAFLIYHQLLVSYDYLPSQYPLPSSKIIPIVTMILIVLIDFFIIYDILSYISRV